MNAGGSWWRRLDQSGAPLLLARIVLAATFLYMGTNKLNEPFDFLKQLRLYHMLPTEPPLFINAAAIVLPWLEIIVGTALLLGLRLRGAAAMIALMLCVFSPAILIRTLHIRAEEGTPFFQIAFDCGCGTGVVTVWTKLLGNVGLLALAFVALLSRSERFCLSAWMNRPERSAAPRG